MFLDLHISLLLNKKISRLTYFSFRTQKKMQFKFTVLRKNNKTNDNSLNSVLNAKTCVFYTIQVNTQIYTIETIVLKVNVWFLIFKRN